jgi:hypothetical protein
MLRQTGAQENGLDRVCRRAPVMGFGSSRPHRRAARRQSIHTADTLPWTMVATRSGSGIGTAATPIAMGYN